MFTITSRRLRGLNLLLMLALLGQLLNGGPIPTPLTLPLEQIGGHLRANLELWCLALAQPIYQTVVRRRRRRLLRTVPAQHKWFWLMRWLFSTSTQRVPGWLPRCGLLLILLVWKGETGSPLAWALLAGPLAESLCLGLGFLCRPSTSSGGASFRWRRRWWRVARGLSRVYPWMILLLAGMPRTTEPITFRADFVHHGTVPLLMGSGCLVGSLVVPSQSEKRQTETPGRETEMAESGLGWPVSCQVAVSPSESLPGEIIFCGGGPETGWVLLVQDETTLHLIVQNFALFRIPRSDGTGLHWLAHQLAYQGWMSLVEATEILSCSLRTVQRDQAAYKTEQDSACWVDGRRFNPGQRTAYRLTAHQGELICEWVLLLLADAPTNGRTLEDQLESLLDDRTIDRAMERLGLNAAEAAGVRQKAQDFLEKVRQEAYWAGVENRPLLGMSAPNETEGSKAEPTKTWPTLPKANWEQQIGDCVTTSLATLHLVGNGAYEAALGLLAKRKGLVSAVRAWHTLWTHLLASGGARLSQAKYRAKDSWLGLLGGQSLGTSASFLRQWSVDVAEEAKEPVTVQRNTGQEETITRLQAYQEESVAQRVRRGLVKAQGIWLDCYINEVSRRERIARTWHGTKHWSVKAFRRNIAQDVETGQAVTCPLSPSDVTPLHVLKQVVDIINGGLDRAGATYRLGRVTADRWWSVAQVLAYCLDENLGFLCWAKAVKTVVDALELIDEKDPAWKEIKKEVADPDGGQVEEKVVGYRLETEVTVYDLSKPVRAIVDWDGEAGGRKMMRLALGVTEVTLETEGACDELRFRQRVEIVLKFLQRWLQLPNFGGGQAVARADERVCPNDEESLKKLNTERKKTATRLRNARAKLEQVETELAYLKADEKDQRQPSNSLGLGVQDLRSLAKRLQDQIGRAQAKLQELETLIAWGKGEGPAPEQETNYDLDLTREAIMTQLKLDVLTAYQTLVDEFIELALKPVLREEAERQAAERRRLDKRSTAKGREGQPLSTNVEALYQAKVANLERETILERLLNQPGRYLYHRGERILVTVAQRFSDRRMQAAYERYCYIANRKQIRVPMDEGEDWLLLFTYEKPTSSGDKFK